MIRKLSKYLILFICLSLALSSCRKGDEIIPSTSVGVTDGEYGEIKGFYLLNEGNMGSNKATLDYFDYETGVYTKNIYAERNPGVVKELGDVGNDLQIYGNKLYAVINCSNLIEIMDVTTAKHIKLVSVPNCRYITFKGKYAYISSYAGPVEIDPNTRLGYIAKMDTTNFEIVSTCIVGYQPEEMIVVGDKLYVANSGGYRVPNYDSTIYIIDLNTFKEIKKIDIAINLHRMELDKSGLLYVSSRGDYYETSSKTYVLDTKTDMIVDKLNLLPNSNMTLDGDSLYVYSTEWNHTTNTNTVSYAIYDVNKKLTVTRNFITDGTAKNIVIPYGVAVNPNTKEIYVTDAKDYVTPGVLYCFNPDGTKKWEVITGDIPAHIAFTRKRLQPLKK